MHMKQTNELLKHEPMLMKLAWSFNKTTGIDFQELLSEARVCYYEAAHDYDPDNASGAKLITYAWNRVKHGLIAFCKKEKRNKTMEFDDNNEKVAEDLGLYEEMNSDHSILDELEGMGKVVANYLLKDPDVDIHQTPRKVKGDILMIMRCDGYSNGQIFRGFNEIKTVIQQW